jgi:hypothetical protein
MGRCLEGLGNEPIGPTHIVNGDGTSAMTTSDFQRNGKSPADDNSCLLSVRG